MNVNELHALCKDIIDLGEGDSEVYFDSCARWFDVHLVNISNGFLECHPNSTGTYLILNYDMSKSKTHNN